MRDSLTGSLRLLFFSVLLSLPIYAADAKLLVKCTKESGEAVTGIKVFAQEVRTNKVAEQKTNKQGVAEFKKLPEGVYRVVSRAEGFEPVLHEFVSLTAGDQKTLALSFKPGDMSKKFYFEDPAVGAKLEQTFKESIALLQQNKYAEAEAKIKEVLAINPTIPGARQNLAVAYLNQQKWEEAEKELKIAIENANTLKILQPAAAASYDQMAAGFQKLIGQLPIMKLQMEIDADLKANKNEEAVVKLQKMTELMPSDPNTWYNLALSQAKLKRFEEAKQSIAKAATLKPGDKPIEDLKRMLAENEKAIALQQVQQLVDAGDAAFKAKNYQEARAKFLEAQKDAPPEVQGAIWANLARTYRQLNEEQSMVEAYRKAIELGDAKAPYAQELAEYYFDNDKVSEGIQTVAGLQKGGSASMDETLFSLGAGYMKKNKKKIAQALFEETLKANSQHAEAHYELGMLYFYELKDADRATGMLKKYTSMGKDPNHLESAKAVLIVIEKTVPKTKPAAAKKK